MSRRSSIINGVSLIGGIVGAVFAFISRMLSGSPIDMLHKLGDVGVMPPIWIFNLLSVAWYFLIGAAAGNVIKNIADGSLCGRSEAAAYRGLAFFLVAFFMGLIWYPVFFVSQAIFISLLVCLITTLTSVLCAYAWLSAGETAAGVIVAAYSIWTVYIFIINFSISFGI